MAAVNCIGRAGGFSEILARLQVNDPPAAGASGAAAEPAPAPEPEPEPAAAAASKPPTAAAAAAAVPVELIQSFAEVLVNSRMLLNKHFGRRYLPQVRFSIAFHCCYDCFATALSLFCD